MQDTTTLPRIARWQRALPAVVGALFLIPVPAYALTIGAFTEISNFTPNPWTWAFAPGTNSLSITPTNGSTGATAQTFEIKAQVSNTDTINVNANGFDKLTVNSGLLTIKYLILNNGGQVKATLINQQFDGNPPPIPATIVGSGPVDRNGTRFIDISFTFSANSSWSWNPVNVSTSSVFTP